MNETLKEFVELLADFDTAILVTETAAGSLTSRPMAVQKSRPDRALWFVTSKTASSAENIAATGKINLSYRRKSDQAWVSVSGRAVINSDRALIEQLWQSDWDTWFKDGRDSRDVVLLDIEPHQIDFWEPDHGKLGTLLQYAKATLSDTTPDLPPTKTLMIGDAALSGAMKSK